MKLFHRHLWVSLSINHLEKSWTVLRGAQAGKTFDLGPITEVLQRCECGDVRTIELDGRWTLEEITQGEHR